MALRRGSSAAPSAARRWCWLDDLAVDPHGERVGVDLDSGGSAFYVMSALPRARASRRARGCVRRRSRRSPSSNAAGATNVMDVGGGRADGAEHRPWQHRLRSGDRGVGVAHGRVGDIPPLITTYGRTPKNAGSQSTKVGEFAASTEPTSPSMPCARPGRSCTWRRSGGGGGCRRRSRRRPGAPARRFMTCAVCQVRVRPRRCGPWPGSPSRSWRWRRGRAGRPRRRWFRRGCGFRRRPGLRGCRG